MTEEELNDKAQPIKDKIAELIKSSTLSIKDGKVTFEHQEEILKLFEEIEKYAEEE